MNNKKFKIFLILSLLSIIYVSKIFSQPDAPDINEKRFSLSDGEYIMLLKMNLQKGKYSYCNDREPESAPSKEIKKGAIDQDHILRLNFQANPSDFIKGVFQIEISAGDPYLHKKDIWQNDVGEFLDPKIGAYLTRADFTISSKFLDTRIYKWAKHQSSGDLLDLYPAEWDLEQSRRWGTFAPEGIEITGKDTLKNLFIAEGQVPSYHSCGMPNSSAFFIKYSINMEPFFIMLLYKHKLVKTHFVDSHSGEYTPPSYPSYLIRVDDKVGAIDVTLDMLKFIEGFDMLLEAEIAGCAPIDPSVVPENDKKDIYLKSAFKSRYNIIPECVQLTGRYDFSDVYVGNLKKLNGGISLKPVYSLKISVDGTSQEPIRAPGGTNFASLPFVINESRKAQIFKASITYDPTPLSDFDSVDANILEDAPVAFQLSYVNSYYPTWTDIPIKIDYISHIYEIYGDGVYGLHPIELHKGIFKLISSYWYPYQIILYFEAGKKQAELSSSVVPAPWTEYYDTYLEFMKIKNYSFSFLYARSDWETPRFNNNIQETYDVKLENFHKELGLPIDHRWVILIKKYFGKSCISLKYEKQIIDFSSKGYKDAEEYSESELGKNYAKLQRTEQITAIFTIKF